MSREAELKYINHYVQEQRRRLNVEATPGDKVEMSCIGFGEMRNVVNIQLVFTTEGTGCWRELESLATRREAVRYIRNIRRFERQRRRVA